MEHASVMFGVSFGQNPRDGQKEVFGRVANGGDKYLNVQLPTGYGKTFVACGSYSILKAQGRVNRLFMVFPTDGQLEQFKTGGDDDLRKAGVDGPLQVVDLRFFGTEALRKHRKNTAQVFAITVQSLINRSGMDITRDLFGSGGRWMLCVDEYHHYGIEAAWGKSVKALPAEFTLAMSATPRRKNGDSAFGQPDIAVKYRDAVKECAVKPLVGHSYVYRLDLLDNEGDVQSVTTSDLYDMAGTNSPEKIDAFLITRKMRWSPKYVSPLVSVPIERMIGDRIKYGKPLQVIVGAMSVSHAEMVCGQIKGMYGDSLRVDWVGTGDNGRKPEVNRQIINKFCPPKDEHGKRNPTLDVLVHVGMAGEGLDSIYVSEVIHLNAARWNNSNDQENGRAARYLPGVVGNINFDSSSEYAEKGYVGSAIMDAMDAEPPQNDDDEDETDEVKDRDYTELPDEPAIEIRNLELDHINSGDPRVAKMKTAIEGITGEVYDDPNHPMYQVAIDRAIRAVKEMTRIESEQFNEESIVKQWQEQVGNATTKVTGLAIRILYADQRHEKSAPGDIKKRINSRKRREVGAVAPDIDVCKAHYKWIKSLERELLNGEVPQWLK